MKHAYILLPTGNGIPLGNIADGILEALRKQNLKTEKFVPFSETGSGINGRENGITFAEVRDALISDCEQVIMERVVENTRAIFENNDVTLIEGISNPAIFYKKELHRLLTSALDVDVILVANAAGKSPEMVISEIRVEEHFHKAAKAFLAGCIILGVPDEEKEYFRTECQKSEIPVLAFVHSSQNITKESVYFGMEENPWEHTLKETREHRMSPAEFRNFLIRKAQKFNAKIVLPEGSEHRTVRAAILCLQRKIAYPILLAKREDVEKTVAKLSMALPPELEIIDPETIAEKYIPRLVDLRKSKGMTEEQAAKMLSDSVWVGTMMVKAGDADGLVSGALHSTADTVRPALTIIKTQAGTSLISSVFLCAFQLKFWCMATAQSTQIQQPMN